MASEMEKQCIQNGSSTTANGSGYAPEVKKSKVTETPNNTHHSHQRLVTEIELKQKWTKIFLTKLHASIYRHDEFQYLDAVQNILQNGVQKGDRTGVGTLSVFGVQCRYSLRDG